MRTQISLRNKKTGQMDTFKADERGIINLPPGEWEPPVELQGVFSIAEDGRAKWLSVSEDTGQDEGEQPNERQ